MKQELSTSNTVEESTTRFRAHFTEFVVNLFITILFWIFGLAVYIPLSSVILGSPSVSPLVAFIFLVAISYTAVRLLYSGKRAVDSYANISKMNSRRFRNLGQDSWKSVGYIALSILGGIIFTPITLIISPVFGGITAAVVVLTILFLGLPLMGNFLDGSRRKTVSGVK